MSVGDWIGASISLAILGSIPLAVVAGWRMERSTNEPPRAGLREENEDER